MTQYRSFRESATFLDALLETLASNGESPIRAKQAALLGLSILLAVIALTNTVWPSTANAKPSDFPSAFAISWKLESGRGRLVYLRGYYSGYGYSIVKVFLVPSTDLHLLVVASTPWRLTQTAPTFQKFGDYPQKVRVARGVRYWVLRNFPKREQHNPVRYLQLAVSIDAAIPSSRRICVHIGTIGYPIGLGGGYFESNPCWTAKQWHLISAE